MIHDIEIILAVGECLLGTWPAVGTWGLGCWVVDMTWLVWNLDLSGAIVLL